MTAGEDADGDEIVDWGTKVGVKFDFLLPTLRNANLPFIGHSVFLWPPQWQVHTCIKC